jgi:hypothetical protein
MDNNLTAKRIYVYELEYLDSAGGNSVDRDIALLGREIGRTYH